MTRTFVALEMNALLQSRLAEVIRQLAQALPHLRWVDPASIHLTLAFLAELDDAQLEQAIQASLKVASHTHAFSYTLTQPGVFGSLHQPRVIWMGIEEPSGALSRLHDRLNHELLQRSFKLDRKPFSPHFTLARVKSPLSPEEQQRLQKLLAGDQRTFTSSQAYPAKSIQVIKSELARTGAHYTNLRTCSFVEQ